MVPAHYTRAIEETESNGTREYYVPKYFLDDHIDVADTSREYSKCWFDINFCSSTSAKPALIFVNLM